jgi:hypothetical protein
LGRIAAPVPDRRTQDHGTHDWEIRPLLQSAAARNVIPGRFGARRQPGRCHGRTGSDSYYLFGTGGGAWVSAGFVHWKYQPVDVRGGRLPVAPNVVKYNGAFLMSGNDAPLYRAPDILGPYELLGPWKNEKGEPWTVEMNGRKTNGAFDVDIFVDDDNKPYLYFPGRSTAGFYVPPLDPKDPSRLKY